MYRFQKTSEEVSKGFNHNLPLLKSSPFFYWLWTLLVSCYHYWDIL